MTLPTDQPGTQATLRRHLLAILLMLVFFAQATAAIPRLSLTADEPVYMGAGYAFLRSGDLRMAPSAQHPPLLQVLVSLPLLLQPGPELDRLEGWNTTEMARYAPAFVAWYGDHLDGATFAARFPVMLVALVWAAVMFRWASDWSGPWGGIVALSLFAFDPNLLAHANLATNDVGFAAFSFATLFLFVRFRRHPSRWRLILLGVTLGASLSSKSSGFFTALVLAVLFPLTALIDSPPGERVRRVTQALLQLGSVVLLGMGVLWATYGFELRSLGGEGLPVPMATQWKVWREMRGHLSTGHTAYLMGEIRDTGWLAYYPLAFALKTPLLTLALLAVGLAVAILAGPRQWMARLEMWVYLGSYSAAALLSQVNTGYRFLLPILPFCFLVISTGFRTLARHLDRSTLKGWRAEKLTHVPMRHIACGVLFCGYVAGTLRLFPHYLAYFNLLAGGPAGGHRYLVDSNLDWGQSFKALESYLDEQDVGEVRLSTYTYTDPALYGMSYQPIAPAPGAPPILPGRFNPPPGVYVIGATTLQGVMLVEPDTYDWFRHREPVARPGWALFVYQVPTPTAGESPAWLAQCITGGIVPLSDEVAAEGFGQLSLRQAYFECDSSWLYPAGGQTSGWYAFTGQIAASEAPFIQTHLRATQLSYKQRQGGTSPPFAIYKWDRSSPPSPPSSPTAPVRIGHLTFLGYAIDGGDLVHPGQTVDVETWWRVDQPPDRLLSIMMHLIEPTGPPVAVADGLGVPIESWQIGDVLVQRHQLALPAGLPPGEYDLTTGVYWLYPTERWPVESGGESIGDQLRLSTIQVTSGE